jgi:hypothetical protein
MLDIRVQPLPVSLALPDVPDDHLEICRLLAAATVNPSFCRLLLDEPEQALRSGYHGEFFLLSGEERDLILSIGADSLDSLAWQVYRALGHRTPVISSHTADATELIVH